MDINENDMINNTKITINDIRNDLYNLDTVYREALAHSLIKLNYVSDSPLNLSMGTEEQQQELKSVYEKPLKAKQVKEIIDFISNEMKGDFQYESFTNIISKYINIANEMEKNIKVLNVKLVGIDDWNRPVYKDKKGNLYKDVNLGQGIISLCTSCSNDFYGEPDIPVKDDVKINIIKNFEKDKER